MYGRTVMFPPSRFLEEIPRHLIETALVGQQDRSGAARGMGKSAAGRRVRASQHCQKTRRKHP